MQRLNAVTQWIAQYSCGIYICHIPILGLCFVKLHVRPAWLAMFFSAALTALIAFVLYHCIEAPGIRSGKLLGARPALQPHASLLVQPRRTINNDMHQQTVQILGSRVHLISAPHAVDYIDRWMCSPDDRCHQVIVTGFHGLMEAHKSPYVHAVLNEADLWIPDGIAPVWIARARGHRSAVRAPGAEVMKEFLRRANERGYSSYFFGDTEATLDILTKKLAADYPGHRIAGAYSPPFRPCTTEEEDAIIDRINAARPDVLWVALGSPKQDLWIHRHLQRLQVPVAIGVGAAFGFLAGTVSRCPEWVGSAGFEWVYRLLKEPRKLWRRDLLDGPRFLFLAGMELLRSENLLADHSRQP